MKVYPEVILKKQMAIFSVLASLLTDWYLLLYQGALKGFFNPLYRAEFPGEVSLF